MEISEFVKARLDEDETVAREAAGLTECWIAEEPAIGVVLVDGEPLIEGHIRGLTAHIARHDPARVLREIAAKRAIVAAYTEVASMDIADPEPEFAYGRAVGLGEAARHLAAVWSDHPGYRQEWA